VRKTINNPLKQNKMKFNKNIFRIQLAAILLMVPFLLFAQEAEQTEKPVKKEVKKTFENPVLINNQTVEGMAKKSLDFMIQHRFGTIEDENDMFGLFAPSNIRLGLTYGILDRLSVGIGSTKNKRLYDLSWKYIILRQTKPGGFPVTITYYGNLARQAGSHTLFLNQDKEYKQSNRISYFHELMVARKVTNRLSLQAAGNWSYYNLVDTVGTGRDRAYLGVSFIGRYQFSPQSSIIAEFDLPITTWNTTEITKTGTATNGTVTELVKYFPKPNPGIGYEVATSGHQFQIFVCSAAGIVNQEYRVFNQNAFFDKGILLGFNITRQWGF
jgi:hypothetical protein